MKKKILWLLVSCLMVIALVLTSCGPTAVEEKEEAAVEEKEEVAPSTPPAKPTGPQYGGTLRWTWRYEASSLDCALSNLGGDAYFSQQMYDTFIGGGRDLVPVQGWSLAESWEFPNPESVVFYIRKGVKFHDGTTFNAEAFKFNMDRMMDPEAGCPFRATFHQPIKSVEVVDDYTAKLYFNYPWAACLSSFMLRCVGMNSPTAVEKLGDDYPFQAVGTGPFKLKEYIVGSHCTLVRFDDYWRKDDAGNKLPYLDEIIISIIPDEAVASAALEAGELDVVTALPKKDVDKFAANPDFQLVTIEGSSIVQLFHFNRSIPPMDDVHLRRALIYGVDPVAVNKAIFFSKHIAARGGMWPVGGWAYDPTVRYLFYDPEKAKEELRLGGMPDGYRVEMITNFVPYMAQSIEMYQAQLAEVGIELVPILVDDVTKTTRMNVEKAFSVEMTGWPLRTEPSIIASYSYKEGGYYNPGGELAPNPVMEELVDRGTTTYGVEERKPIYRQIDNIAINDCWYVPLIYSVTDLAAANRVKGLDTIFISNCEQRMLRVWLEK